MRRADRLFQIVQALRGGRLVTARDLARRLEVSERTVYRDMAELIGLGVPITGEAGVGYVLRGGYDIPPLMFTPDELEALAVGARMVQALAGADLAGAAAEAIAKIDAVIPAHLRDDLAGSRLFVPDFLVCPSLRERLDLIRHAIAEHRVLSFTYSREDGHTVRRSVRPLGLFFWGKVWTLGAWCELRGEFRNFRADRMAEVTVETRTFREDKGRTLQDFLRAVRG
jgi:predicted DNA-binding transcriptional regulator YafY